QNNNSNHEVAVSGNMSSSQNESDVSMHDVVGNQSLSHMELINEEYR
ncbi:5264_t:CDS:1, partial [Acaulospora morrowiae]